MSEELTTLTKDGTGTGYADLSEEQTTLTKDCVQVMMLYSEHETWDGTTSIDALACYIDPEWEIMKICYPLVIGGHFIESFLKVVATMNESMAFQRYSKIYEFYYPRPGLMLFDTSACCVLDMVHILGGRRARGGQVGWWSLGLQPKPFTDDDVHFWLGAHLCCNYASRIYSDGHSVSDTLSESDSGNTGWVLAG